MKFKLELEGEFKYKGAAVGVAVIGALSVILRLIGLLPSY